MHGAGRGVHFTNTTGAPASQVVQARIPNSVNMMLTGKQVDTSKDHQWRTKVRVRMKKEFDEHTKSLNWQDERKRKEKSKV